MILRRSTSAPHTTLEVLAPAKVNLFLEVQARRDDGYHELETIMVTVNLHDRIRLTCLDQPASLKRVVEEDGIDLTCDDPSLPIGPENLATRAGLLLRREAHQRDRMVPRTTIALYKQIPAQAGLGGGSSDAAAVLVGLDRLWDLRLGPEQLAALAAELGSDVPFLLGPEAAICRGRGEHVEPLSLAPERPLHLVLVCPPIGLSTASVYGRLRVPSAPRTANEVLEALTGRTDRSRLGSALFNRLQEPAEALQPELVRVRDALQNWVPSHLDGVLMSGSGSAYFGLSRNRDAALSVADALNPLGLGSVRVLTSGP